MGEAAARAQAMQASKVSPEKLAEVFARFVANRKILIADEHGSARAGLARTLSDMGAKTSNLSLASSISAAEEEINRVKPHIVICDYDLGRGAGLTLLQMQRKNRPESKDSLFVLVTGNTSQSAVAQAAEEDVDTYIIKPYTIESLRRSIMTAAMAKIQPDQYLVTIDKGKEQLAKGQIEEATLTFTGAMTLNPKPALACFYLGQANLIKNALDPAQGSYSAGLSYNKIHYKCLIGLYELLMKRNMHQEAYDVVKKISQYFPANPQRMAAILRLAIVTKSYDDIEAFYQTFTNLEVRTEETIRYVCAALVVCGKYYLQTNFKSRALSLFQKAAVTGTGRPKILREIITILATEKLAKDASDFFKRFPAETQGTPDYIISEYLIANESYSNNKSIEHGRKLIQQGIHDPAIYATLIRRAVAAGQKEALESFVAQAKKAFPERTAEFDRLSGASS